MLAAARALHSSYCSLAHGSILRQHFFSPEQLSRIASDYTPGGLARAEVAMMAYVEKLVHDASTIDAADIQALHDHGFTDPEIFDIAAVASARCFFSTLLDALGAEPDLTYLNLEAELRSELTVGRPISTMPPEQLSAATNGS
jgi:alkylhydroperoxidase family enzyme